MSSSDLESSSASCQLCLTRGVCACLQAAIERGFPDRVQVVLGTEAGMITSIVRAVQRLLSAPGNPGVDVEVVFPVAPQAIATSEQVELPGGLKVMPGVAAGEGCSLEGGCAACPYMKMNSLAALMTVCNAVGSADSAAMLAAHEPKPYSELVRSHAVSLLEWLTSPSCRNFGV